MLLKCFKSKQVVYSIEIDNANLILICPHLHFQQKNLKVPFCQNTVVKS